MLTRRERDKAEDLARKLWNSLDMNERFEIGDQLVLGCFDWRDWFGDKPPKGTIVALDRLRIYWEMP